jgi:hypothetical protein
MNNVFLLMSVVILLVLAYKVGYKRGSIRVPETGDVLLMRCFMSMKQPYGNLLSESVLITSRGTYVGYEYDSTADEQRVEYITKELQRLYGVTLLEALEASSPRGTG